MFDGVEERNGRNQFGLSHIILYARMYITPDPCRHAADLCTRYEWHLVEEGPQCMCCRQPTWARAQHHSRQQGLANCVRIGKTCGATLHATYLSNLSHVLWSTVGPVSDCVMAIASPILYSSSIAWHISRAAFNRYIP